LTLQASGQAQQLSLAGTYQREVGASLARVWENVFDWEHLPALHQGQFNSIALIDSGAWGWRARVLNQPGNGAPQIIEVRADRAADHYVSATVEGPGAGSEVRTWLTPLAPDRTRVSVEFHVPEGDPARLALIGGRYRAIYARLWDEDEAMMVERERALARRRAHRDAGAETLVLGPGDAVRAAAPLLVEFGGQRFRIVDLDGELIVHAATCPHWLGPLDSAPVRDGCVRCPWHDYAFDVRTGNSTDGRNLRLATPPALVLREGQLMLVAA
jgi:nitrite reductase/ring-hydroxylating ferredoxin subunit